MDVLVAGLTALIAGFFLGAKLNAKVVAPALTEVSRAQAIDRSNFLQTLRRELANILIWRDPQRYLLLYRQLHSELATVPSWREEEVTQRLAALCKTYPHYSDFDCIGTREYVLYADGVSSNADLEARYRDIVTFSALAAVGDPAWKDAATRGFIHVLSDDELAHLSEYVRRVEDTKLQLRIDDAMDTYRGLPDDQHGVLDCDFCSVRLLPHFAENRYGIHLKGTGEFAIYSFFVFDDGRLSHSYLRSDPTFQQEIPLRALHAVVEGMKRPR